MERRVECGVDGERKGEMEIVGILGVEGGGDMLERGGGGWRGLHQGCVGHVKGREGVVGESR